MKINRYLALIIALIIIQAGAAQAQITNTTSTEFAVLDTVSEPSGLMVGTEPYYMADNRVLATRSPVTVVATWSTNATADSAWSYTRNQRREWVVTLTTWNSADSTLIFTINEYQSSDRTLLATYTQAVDYGYCGGSAHCVPDFGGTALGLNLSLANYATILTSTGWSWHLYLWDIGQIPISRLTIIPAWSDTIGSDADTVYSPAVWGGYRWMNLGFKGITSSMGDDGNNWIGFGQQRKFDDEWYEIEVISDSFRIPLTIGRDTTFAHPVADSIRFPIWGNGSTTNFYLESLKFRGRN